MKSGCAANEITLWQPGSLCSTAALSMGSALLEGHLCREPPKTCSRQWGQAAGPLPACPPAWAQSPPPAAAPALPSSQQGAESGMAYNETPITGFPLLHQHGFPRGAAARVCWEGRPAGLGLLGVMASLGRLAWMLGEGGGVCSTCGDCIASFRVMLLMSSSHKLAEKRPSTLVLASPGVIPECSQSRSIKRKEKGRPFPYEISALLLLHF